MTKIGELNDRQIFYTNVRTDSDWFDKLPSANWLALTIADTQDKDLLNDTVIKCIDKNVLYTCSLGQLASETEDYFDEEIVWRQVQIEEQTGIAQDNEPTPMTSFHRNFDEGFWFATTVAKATTHEDHIPIETVICVDMTQQGVRKYLLELVDKIKKAGFHLTMILKFQNMTMNNC